MDADLPDQVFVLLNPLPAVSGVPFGLGRFNEETRLDPAMSKDDCGANVRVLGKDIFCKIV